MKKLKKIIFLGLLSLFQTNMKASEAPQFECSIFCGKHTLGWWRQNKFGPCSSYEKAYFCVAATTLTRKCLLTQVIESIGGFLKSHEPWKSSPEIKDLIQVLNSPDNESLFSLEYLLFLPESNRMILLNVKDYSGDMINGLGRSELKLSIPEELLKIQPQEDRWESARKHPLK